MDSENTYREENSSGNSDWDDRNEHHFHGAKQKVRRVEGARMQAHHRHKCLKMRKKK